MGSDGGRHIFQMDDKGRAFQILQKGMKEGREGGREGGWEGGREGGREVRTHDDGGDGEGREDDDPEDGDPCLPIHVSPRLPHASLSLSQVALDM